MAITFFKTIAETKELHAIGTLRSRYYKTNYKAVKEAILEYASANKLTTKHVDDEHKEIYLQGTRYHIMVSVVQINPIETSVDFKVQHYGLIGMNRPIQRIDSFYQFLDTKLPFKGVGLHP
jgi:hypothetical protein